MDESIILILLKTLHLIPNTLGSRTPLLELSAGALEALRSCPRFVVESVPAWGRLMRDACPEVLHHQRETFLLNEHTDARDLLDLSRWLQQTDDIGCVTDAGCPGVADPGAQLVRMAHHAGWRVIPHIGPSSILLAMMASGMNGQSFAFKGYLPRDPKHRDVRWREMREGLQRRRETQIFMEPPYRNDSAFRECLERLDGEVQLAVAVDLTLETEWIRSHPVAAWKAGVEKEMPILNKRPCLFLLGM